VDTFAQSLDATIADRLFVTGARGRSDAIAQQDRYAAVIRAMGKAHEWGIEATPPPRKRKGWSIWAVRYKGQPNTVNPDLRYVTGSTER
jgi:hypothetical protein